MRMRALITTGATAAGLLLGPAAAAVAAPPPSPSAARVADEHTFDFESGTEGWVAGKDDRLPDGTVTWSSKQAKSGTHSLEFWLDGLQDDGTLWVSRELPVPPGRTSIDVEMSFWVWSASDTPTISWWVVAQAGRTAPTQEDDFTKLEYAEHAGWHPFTYRTTIDTRGLSTFHASFGLSVTWEDDTRVHNFDLAQIKVT
ncbi:hypothetical protein AGRA3207_004389 [Actinomadura graeca]|uniref:Uncharacterized protein n=1 Tax=Actinomadura graeca TaxID=2750812 RepID=A0ABX8QWW6_9ACTN|nr:hypothetical protein [Actinomadura graeca]QXJ23255.1 hypothetical protein AGRA3207_004389 [Actinomadura graeca]